MKRENGALMLQCAIKSHFITIFSSDAHLLAQVSATCIPLAFITIIIIIYLSSFTNHITFILRQSDLTFVQLIKTIMTCSNHHHSSFFKNITFS